MKNVVEEIKRLSSYKVFTRIVFALGIRNHLLIQSVESDFFIFENQYYKTKIVLPLINDISKLIKGYEDECVGYFDESNLEVNPWLVLQFKKVTDKKKFLPYFILFHAMEGGYSLFSADEYQGLPEVSDDKYGLTYLSLPLNVECRAIQYDDMMYYYHPLLELKPSYLQPPSIVHYISLIDVSRISKMGIRFIDGYCVPLNSYIDFRQEFSEKYYGPSYSIDAVFDYDVTGTTVHINSDNENKLLVRITNVDGDKWIEIEELLTPGGNVGDCKSRTIHAILDIHDKAVKHIDGHINFYNRETYIDMHRRGTSIKTDRHIKLWLVEGRLTIVEWANMCRAYLDEYNLLDEIFQLEDL